MSDVAPLKPTIINGAWVYAPPPPQDAAFIARLNATTPLSPIGKEHDNTKDNADDATGNNGSGAQGVPVTGSDRAPEVLALSQVGS